MSLSARNARAEGSASPLTFFRAKNGMDRPTIHNGAYTISSPKGGHRTFEIRTIRKGNLKDKRILSLLTGPDNTSDYTAFAFVTNEGINIWRKYAGDNNFRAFASLIWSLATEGDRSPFYARGYRLMLEGRCCVCNRRLTHPDSIATGIGPECGSRSR